MLNDPVVKVKRLELGTIPAFGSVADFRKLLEKEMAKWAVVVKASGASLD